jgi:serine/threonine protein kinase
LEDYVYNETPVILKKQPRSEKALKERDVQSKYCRLEHHLMPLLGHYLDKDNNLLTLVLPYYPDGDLLDEINTHGVLPISKAKKLASHLFSAVGTLHKSRIAHCDIALENILYDKKFDNYILFDFGSVIKVDKETHLLSTLKGVRMQYLSPQLSNRDSIITADDRLANDVWACGVLIFMALTGRPPFDRASFDDYQFDLIYRGEMMDYFRSTTSDEALLEGIEFSLSLLVYDSDRRPTAAEVLLHPWLQ